MTRKALRYVKWGFFFLLFNLNIGRIDLLPNFVGAFFLLQSLRSQEMMETERRLCPLWAILMVDYFLHWIWDFEYVLESLVMNVISTYAMYVLLGEIAGRVAKTQPEQAQSLHYIRVALTALTVLGYLLGAYGELQAVMMWILIGMLIVLFALLGVLLKIKPVDEMVQKNLTQIS